MTDANGILQGQDVSSSPVAASPQPAETHSQPAAQAEKSFTQTEINDIVGRAKHEAVERYKRAQETTQAQVQQQPAQTNVPYSTDDIRRMAAEEVQRSWKEQRETADRMSQEKEAQRIATDFFAKLSSGKEKYQDFDNVVGTIAFQNFPKTVQLAYGYVDNTADVMYHLGNDRLKMAGLEALADKSPEDAVKLMQQLSQSIKTNSAAQNVKRPNEPLSQLRPTNTGTDNGVMGVKDLRAKYKV